MTNCFRGATLARLATTCTDPAGPGAADFLHLLELHERLSEAKTSAAFESALADIREWLGLQELLVARACYQDHAVQRRVLESGYDAEWLSTYLREGFDRVDPIVAEILNGNRFFVRERVIADTDGRRAPRVESVALGRRFAEAAHDFGRPTQGYAGGTVHAGQLQMFSAITDGCSDAARTAMLLRGLQPVLHHAFAHVCGASVRVTSSLSAREHELLAWLAHGKSDAEISCILGISVSTVRFHLGNLLAKLGAANRCHAVAQAYRLGILSA